MVAVDVEQIYQSQIKLLTRDEQLRLVAIITNALVQDTPQQEARKESILNLEGVGADLWHGIDAQEYVNRLRDEWDERS